jgi:[acyl-carrier-protein] S-malonyltransferase
MGLIVLFSGQGHQGAEHLARLATLASPDLAAALAAALPGTGAGEPGGADLAALPPAAFTANRVAQPLLCAYQLALWRQLAPRLPAPTLVAGYSLGEMAAAAVAGLYPPSTAVALCATRARLMDACLGEPAGLLAVLGLAEHQLRALAAACGAVVAIRNGPRHAVVGGPQAALAQLAEAALASGATRVVPLAVHVPSHTPLLRPAAEALAAELGARVPSAPDAAPGFPLPVPLASGIDGRLLRRADEARAALAAQVATPLDWAACMETVREARPAAVLEIGPGNALARLLGDTAPELAVRACDDFRSLAAVVDWLHARGC